MNPNRSQYVSPGTYTSPIDPTTTSEIEQKKLDTLVENSNQILYKTRTVFPFHLFPKEIIVDINKVSVLDRQLFDTGRIRSITIRTISDIFIDTGFLFAKLSIIDRDFTENSMHIDYLPRDEAVKIRRIIQGLMVGYEKGIDFTKLSAEEIVDKLEEIGKIYND